MGGEMTLSCVFRRLLVFFAEPLIRRANTVRTYKY